MKKLNVCIFSFLLVAGSLFYSGTAAQADPALPLDCSDPAVGAPSELEQIDNPTLCVMTGVSAATGYDSLDTWSGVYVTSPNKTYTQVVGRLQVPTRNPNSCQGSTLASWVGIGGVHSQHLIQAGLTYVKGSSYPQAFYEVAGTKQGDNLTIFSMVLHPSDLVNMSVTYDRAMQRAELAVSNLTTGITRFQSVNIPDGEWDGTTAEWVDERLTITGAQGAYSTPLMDFGQNWWYGAKVMKSDGLWHSMASENNVIFDMESGLHQLAYPDTQFSQSMNFYDTFGMCQ